MKTILFSSNCSCFIYRFTGVTYFALSGMCEGLSDKVDPLFVMDMGTADNKRGLVFTGVGKTMMVFDQKTSRWSVISFDDEYVILELDSEVISFKVIQIA